MPCDLSNMELLILYILYRKKNFTEKAGYNHEKLKNILIKKYKQNFDDAISVLKNNGYIGTVKKKEPKYYIFDFKKTITALTAHGYHVINHGIIHLE